MTNKPIDRPVFLIALSIVILVCLPLIFWPSLAEGALTSAYDWTVDNFGFLYQWAAIGTLGFLGWLAFSKYGKARLGKDDEKPEFSTFSWVAMLFSAGVGASILYWGGIEWAFYIDTPPMDAAPRSDEAITLASTYGMFHWGIVAWGFYALPTVAIAYPFYVHDAPSLRLSTSCHGLFGANFEQGWGARAMDTIFMVALIAGSGTSIGLAMPMITSSLAEVFGFERSLNMNIVFTLLTVAIFMTSSYLGLKKGIKKLSNLNTILAIIFLTIVFLLGPTEHIVKQSAESLRFMVTDFINMITYSDAEGGGTFVKSWTIFYWAWWIAYAPFAGLFITRISRGRTIKQVILAMAAFGSLGAWAFYMILGNYTMYLELNQIIPFTELMNTIDPAEALTAAIAYLPYGNIMLVMLAVLGIVFIATTYDSASYTLAAAATKDLHAGENPSRPNRIFWAVIVGLLPMALMVVGDMKVFQSMVLIASLPVLVIGLLMSVALVRSLKRDMG
jgi:BCCT family betaine/carnitine transporter